MPTAVFEFPLNEKVRTYLRLEQLFKQLCQWKELNHDWQYIGYLESFFTLVDLLERIDIRTDILKDIDAHERNLVHWSQHPQIDNDALQTTLRRIVKLRDQLKSARKLGSGLKDDKFLAAIRQRFAIPGANCSFDLPSLHYWLNQPQQIIHADIKRWMDEFSLVNQAIDITLSFLRERGRLATTVAEKGFYQDVADSRCELIRIECDVAQGYYPVLSGNKHRYAIRFMRFNPDQDGVLTEENSVTFKQACC
ncbi:cell division protein ZapD [Neptunicella marina]|uniref:Cell division protein ZapD n=1 Tax=Neptunicella marina TaxID=2125989 RepID=A0A8J6ITH4_9ALTE|nr:cell division protein ZapD [Neptunicella marina]MBC3765311.1 cell division protein ZapD [Neptunicella marina]